MDTGSKFGLLCMLVSCFKIFDQRSIITSFEWLIAGQLLAQFKDRQILKCAVPMGTC